MVILRRLLHSPSMDEIRKTIIDQLNHVGVTGSELSRRLGKNRAYIQQYLDEKQQTLPHEVRLKIAKELGLKPEQLGVAPHQHHANGRGRDDGLSEDATPFVPPSGHYLSAAPAHFWMLAQKSTSLDQHPEKIKIGDVIVFDLNKSDPAKIPSLTIVAVQLCRRDELTKSLGTATRVFIAPNKLITNSSDLNEIISLDDPTLPFVPVIRGSFVSVVREMH